MRLIRYIYVKRFYKKNEADMHVHIETVRIGKFRKNIFTEVSIIKNVRILKKNIQDALSNCEGERVDLEVIIPARGTKITYALQNITDQKIKRTLREQIPNNIYKGKYSTLTDNCLTDLYSFNALQICHSLN